MAIIHSGEWREEELLTLLGESTDFDFKSGRLLEDYNELRKDLPKHLSAFANSGGGHIIFGVEDDGTITGAPPLRQAKGGRSTSYREWLEQIIPTMTDYPLHSFDVREVVPAATGSAIPPDRVVFVVDVQDSPNAPHQIKDAGIYFHRQAGRSVPAPHHLVDLLRFRPSAAVLRAEVTGIRPLDTVLFSDRTLVHVHCAFKLTNESHTANARHWRLWTEFAMPAGEAHFLGVPDGATDGVNLFPGDAREVGVRAEVTAYHALGKTSEQRADQVVAALATAVIKTRAFSDSWGGEQSETPVIPLLDPSSVRESVGRSQWNIMT